MNNSHKFRILLVSYSHTHSLSKDFSPQAIQEKPHGSGNLTLVKKPYVLLMYKLNLVIKLHIENKESK